MLAILKSNNLYSLPFCIAHSLTKTVGFINHCGAPRMRWFYRAENYLERQIPSSTGCDKFQHYIAKWDQENNCSVQASGKAWLQLLNPLRLLRCSSPSFSPKRQISLKNSGNDYQQLRIETAIAVNFQLRENAEISVLNLSNVY